MMSDSKRNVVDERFETPKTKARETPWRKEHRFNKYDPTFPKIMFEMMSDGKTIAQVARQIECSKPTLLRWIDEIDDMADAYELGMTNFEADFEDFINKYSVHDDPDTAPPKVNQQLVDMYAKSNLKKFANLDKQGPSVVVNQNNVEGGQETILFKIEELMKDITKSGDALKDSEKEIVTIEGESDIEIVECDGDKSTVAPTPEEYVKPDNPFLKPIEGDDDVTSN